MYVLSIVILFFFISALGHIFIYFATVFYVFVAGHVTMHCGFRMTKIKTLTKITVVYFMLGLIKFYFICLHLSNDYHEKITEGN